MRSQSPYEIGDGDPNDQHRAEQDVGDDCEWDARGFARGAEDNFGAALLYFTGSKEHNVKIRSLALKKKWTLSEWGLYPLDQYDKAKKEVAKPPPISALASKTEEEIYGKLGLDFVEPEMREDRGEV
jgi:DNA polymerase/3'-5' exonuclease PolX